MHPYCHRSVATQSLRRCRTQKKVMIFCVSVLFREINAENLSDEDTELIEEKNGEKCLNVDEVVMAISDILERLASCQHSK